MSGSFFRKDGFVENQIKVKKYLCTYKVSWLKFKQQKQQILVICIMNNTSSKILDILTLNNKLYMLYSLFDFKTPNTNCKCVGINSFDDYFDYQYFIDFCDKYALKIFEEFMKPVVQAAFIVCYNRLRLPKDVAKIIMRMVYKNYYI